MGGRDEETRLIPPDPDGTPLIPAGGDTPTLAADPSQRQPVSPGDAQTVALDPSHGSHVSRPISPSLSSSRGPRAGVGTPGLRRIGDYEIESEIARGGMGIVYKARQLSLNRPVAFKMILAGQFASAADVDRFHVEAEAAAGLEHPNIVPIYEVGEFEGHHFFTMKFVDGRSMAQEMPRLLKAPRDGVRMLVKVCRAIHYAHQHSILHRDLKPANILLDAHGEPHVTDFGLAKRTEGDSQLTQTGMIVGTPSYMAPEQAAPSKVPLTTSADVYSLGAILYEILTGRPPFRGASALDTVMLVLNTEAERPRSINALADRDLETIALKCLEKDPARRYGSAEAAAEDLDRWLNQEPILARPIGTSERVAKWARRRPAIAAMAAAVALATVAGVAGVIWQWREAVYQRGLAAEALISLAAEAQQKELARGKEAAQRAAAEAAQAQEAVARKTADEQRGIAVGALDSLGRFQYVNNVTLADREWAANNIGHVDQLLAASPAQQRNWEWHYLTRLAHMETDALPAPGGRILALAVSPDGARATTVAADLSASLWDLRTRTLLGTVKLDGAPGMEFGQTALSADGSLFMASIHRFTNGRLSQDDIVWDTKTGRRLWTLPQNSTNTFGNYTAVAFSADGTRLVAASIEMTLPSSAADVTQAQMQIAAARMVERADSRLRVWAARTGALLPSAGVVPGRISTMALDPDGQLAIVGTGSGPAASGPADSRILDVATGKVVGTLSHSAGAAAAFSADGRLIAASVPNGIRVWPASGGEERWSWTGKGVGTPAFSSTGRLVVSGLADRSIQVLDAATGRDVTRFTGSAAAVRTVAFAGTDTDIVSADSGILRLFRLTDATRVRVGEGTSDNVQAVGVTPDHRLIVATGLNGGLKAWDVETGRVLYNSTAAASTGPANPLAMMSLVSPINARVLFSGDGRRTPRLSSAMVDSGGGRVDMQSNLRFIDTRSGQEVWRASQGVGARELTLEEVGRALQSGASMGMAMALALDDAGVHAALVTMKMGVNSGPATSGQAGASVLLGSEILLWKAPGAGPAATIVLPNTMAVSAEFSPDGRSLAVLAGAYTKEGPVAAEYRVYDAANGRLLMAFPGARESAPIAFSRDGGLLAAETARNTVTIWDLGHGGRAIELAEHSSAVTRIAFSPDGTRLATLSGQGITLFDIRSGNQLLILRESNGPFSVGEFIAPGKVNGGGTTIGFSADGRQIVQTLVASDPKGIKVTFKVWDGSPVTK